MSDTSDIEELEISYSTKQWYNEDDLEDDDKLWVNACCGCYVGLPKWKLDLDDWHYEPDECGWEQKIVVSKEDWEDESVCINCPSCTAELHQSMDHFEIVE